MSIIFTLFVEQFFIILPTSVMGWGGLVAWTGVIIYLLVIWKRYQKPFDSSNRVLFLVLIFLVPFANLFVGARMPVWQSLPIPGVVLEPEGLAMMFFSAIPWVLAGGLLGPLPAAVVAVLSGLFQAAWGTHSLYTALEITTLAVLFSGMQNQVYRTRVYNFFRYPIIATVVTWLFYPLLFTINSIFFTSGSLTGQIDYALTNVASASVVVGGPLFVAGLLATIVKGALPERWGGQPPWQFAPTESSLESRFLRNIMWLSLVLVLILLVVDWQIAGDAARQILEDRMASVAQIAADGIPYFLDTGQSLIVRIAEEIQPHLEDPARVTAILEEERQSVPFFRNLYVLDLELNAIGGSPGRDFYAVPTSQDEFSGLDLALRGVSPQSYTLPPLDGESAAMVSFIAAIKNQSDVVQGVLVGRTDIQTNPFTRPILKSLESLVSEGGNGYLLDEYGTILYHPDANRLNQVYPMDVDKDGVYYHETAPDGTRQLTFLKLAIGRPWAVVITYPASEFQQLALDIAAPLLGIVVFLSVFAVFLIRYGLKPVTASLKSLAVETDRIAKGQLDHALLLDGEDEVGQLRRSFDQMRISLKDRLDELNRLLEVSQGVATSLEMKDVVRPILESAMVTGACSARIVLSQAGLPQQGTRSEMQSRYGLGELTNTYSRFDDQLLVLMADQDRIVLTNPARTTLLSVHPGATRPEALLSIALRYEKQYYGTLWIAFDEAHTFTREEVRFLTTLASHAALAAAKTRLFWTAEYGRQRLAAILASTPDPVIVTEHKNRLLLVNPAALQVFGLDEETWSGKGVEDVITKPELVALLKSPQENQESIEVSLPDSRIYIATTSAILVDNHKIGKVCVLRDVTHYKQLDALKSEFVATVSHDLRSPLTLIRGYATMLEMVGSLNEQQENYVRKIVTGVESMSRLINNLLDLGRIEANIGLKIEKLSVRDILEQVIETFRLPATQKQLKLNVDMSQITTPIIDADRSMLEQAFHNLLENAIKYTPAGKDIWVRISTRKDRILFEFQDTGIGISSVDIPRLFEKFYRSADREAKKQSGTGLGLAIVKSIADRHGGRVWVESQLGKGSIFFFEIPVRQKISSRKGVS
jgi:PAS domain S-box-containing protein